MELFTALLLGLAAAAGAVLPPGMLNMSVTTISLRCGRWTGFRYAAGIALVFLLQGSLAVIGANFLRTHPGIIEFLKQWAIPVLLLLSVFFFVKWYRHGRGEGARSEEEEEEDLDNPLVKGMSLAALNFLAIPYFFAIATWLLAGGTLSAAFLAKCSFLAGAGAGALLILAAYAASAEWIDDHAHYLTRHVHLLVSGIFGLLAAVQTWRVFL